MKVIIIKKKLLTNVPHCSTCCGAGYVNRDSFRFVSRIGGVLKGAKRTFLNSPPPPPQIPGRVKKRRQKRVKRSEKRGNGKRGLAKM